MKEFIQKLKTLWENRRYRSLLILGIYAVFFAFVFFVFSLGNKPTVKIPLTGLDLFATQTSYRYTVLGDNNESFVIHNQKVNYKGQIYDLDTIPDELKTYDVDYFTINNIYHLIKNSVLESTNYVEMKDTYLIDLNSIATNTMEEKDYGKFYITLYKNSNNNIDKVMIDLLDHKGYQYMIDF